MDTEPQKKRVKLDILVIKEIKKIGQGELLPFTAKISGGKQTAEFECWSKILGKHILKGETIDADVEFTIKESGGTEYKHRKVAQIYDDKGEPILKQTAHPLYRGKSPEEKRSIERQVVLKAAVEMACSKIIDKMDIIPQAEIFDAWIDKRLSIPDKAVADLFLKIVKGMAQPKD